MKGKEILIAILAVMLVSSISTVSGATWWDNSYKNSIKITLNSSLVAEDLVNFPVKIMLNSANFNFSHLQDSDHGFDIRFTTQDNLTELDFDRVTFNSVWSFANYYVLLPQLNASSDTIIYMYYNCTGSGNNADPEFVWKDQYVGVWHMNGSATEVTENDNEPTGSLGTPIHFFNGADGLVPAYAEFNGSDDPYDGYAIPTSVSLNQTVYISAWVYNDDQVEGTASEFNLISSNRNRGLTIIQSTPDTIKSHWYAPVTFSSESSVAWTMDEWSYVVAQANTTSNRAELWMNGTSNGDGVVSAPLGGFAYEGGVAFAGGNVPNHESNVSIGTIKLSNISRTWAWIEADYASESYTLQSMGEPDSIPLGIISLTFIDADEDNWMFYGEAYTFEVESKEGNYTEVAWTDGFNIHRVGWDNSTQRIYKNGSMEIVDYEVDYNETNLNLTITVTMGTGISDSLHHEYTAYNYDTGDEPDYDLGVAVGNTSYINFYHLGGMSTTIITGGGGGRIDGGDVFNLYADPSGTVSADAIYRKLQHFHILFDYGFPEANINRTGSGIEQSIIYNLDFYYDGAWQEGLECSIDVLGGFSGNDGALTEFNVTWSYDNTVLRTDRIIGLYEGGAGETEIKQSTSLYVDLWFNRINGSTLIGGRVYPEWYGFVSTASYTWWKPWTYWDTNWAPLYTNTTHSLAFARLEVNNTLITSKDLELMKVTCTVNRSADGSYSTIIKAINELDFFALNENGYMSGINTPSAHDIKTFEIGRGGIFGSIITALTGVIRAIGEILGGASTIAVSAIDKMLSGWLGEGTFILLVKSIVDPAMGVVDNLSELLEIVPKMVVYFSSVVTLGIELLTYTFDGIYYFIVNGTQLIFFPLQIMSAILSGQTSLSLGGITMDITLVSVIIGAIFGLFEIIMLWESFVWFGGGTHTGGFFDVEFDPFKIPSRLIESFEWMKRIYDGIFWVFHKGKQMLVGAVNALLGLLGRSIGGGGDA